MTMQRSSDDLPKPDPISRRARTVAEGLIRTRRAKHAGILHGGMLRLECISGRFYWISLDGNRLLRGEILGEADELQPKFIEAMVRAGL